MATPDYLANFFTILDRPAPLNSLQASHWAKIVTLLINKKPVEVKLNLSKGIHSFDYYHFLDLNKNFELCSPSLFSFRFLSYYNSFEPRMIFSTSF